MENQTNTEGNSPASKIQNNSLSSSSTTASAVAELFDIIIRVEDFPPFGDPDNPQDRDPNGDGFPDDENVSEPLYEHSTRSTDPDAPCERRIILEPVAVTARAPRIVSVDTPSDFSLESSWRERLEAARAALPIPQVWEMLELEGTPMSSCNSPFRRDLKPSFSITLDGQRWKDWGTDEGGDVFDFLATAFDIPVGDAMRLGIQIAESGIVPPGLSPGNYTSRRQEEALKEKEEKRKLWPPMTAPSDEELQIIADLRGLSVEGLRLAVEDGILVTTTWYRHRAWCLRSSCGRNYQARLMTGKPWGIIDDKVKTLPGSLGSIPIGLPSDRPIIILCEGGPDMLAAYCCINELGLRDQVGVVGMMGTSPNFKHSELGQLAGKRVRIFVHSDNVGKNAGSKWAKQLQSVGVRVDGFSFEEAIREDNASVKDLNDLVRLPRCETSSSFMRNAFDFSN